MRLTIFHHSHERRRLPVIGIGNAILGGETSIGMTAVSPFNPTLARMARGTLTTQIAELE